MSKANAPVVAFCGGGRHCCIAKFIERNNAIVGKMSLSCSVLHILIVPEYDDLLFSSLWFSKKQLLHIYALLSYLLAHTPHTHTHTLSIYIGCLLVTCRPCACSIADALVSAATVVSNESQKDFIAVPLVQLLMDMDHLNHRGG
jgi:hypothetical protein